MSLQIEKRDKNDRVITDINLHKTIQDYNRNHALKFDIHINEAGYNVLTITFPENEYPKAHQPIRIEPMTNLEAYYFIKGFMFLKDRPA